MTQPATCNANLRTRAFARSFQYLAAILVLVFITILSVAPLPAAPPTAQEEAAVRGTWRVVLEGQWKRVYEIDVFRNVTIEGGNLEKKKGKLVPFQDGGFIIPLDATNLIRVTYYEDTDELLLVCYKDQATFDKGLDPRWKIVGTRIVPRKP